MGRFEAVTLVKYIDKMTFQDIYELHKRQCQDDTVSRTTLKKAWTDSWKNVMRMRNKGFHQRCSKCAENAQRRKNAANPEQKEAQIQMQSDHIEHVMADRKCGERSSMLSENAARHPSADGAGQVLKVTIDGMDQAKFKCPRNLQDSKSFSTLWRPQLHVAGAIAWGHIEAFFIMGPEVSKDSNMETTVLARMLDLVNADLLCRGAVMPQTLILETDGCSGEGQNQHFQTANDYLIAEEKFEASQHERATVGHTHNHQDQRFSSVATSLASAPVLQDPTEFKDQY